ncbi:unnamed protein product [Owenia fusiformis]|uniref:Protein DP71L n=1 Tax=Owenia fusiformis TaxID=6347 RepID=A0A8J1U2Z6_OWEFU|nr:unnamed protein product [Owenia fusiformis]
MCTNMEGHQLERPKSSSRWLKTSTPNLHVCDTGHVHPKNILRLNSTGEISSDDDLNLKQNKCYWDKMKEKATNLTNIGKLDIQNLLLGSTPISKQFCAKDQEVSKSVMDKIRQYQNECVCDSDVSPKVTSYRDALHFGNKRSFLQGLMMNRSKILHNLDCLQGRQNTINKYPTYSEALSGKHKQEGQEPIKSTLKLNEEEAKAPSGLENSAVSKNDLQSVPRYIPPYKRKNVGGSGKENDNSVPNEKYISPKPRPPRNYTPRQHRPPISQTETPSKSNTPRQYAKEKHYSKRADFCERNYEENWRQPRPVRPPSQNRDGNNVEHQNSKTPNSNMADVRFNYQIRIGTSPKCDKSVLAHCHSPRTVSSDNVEDTERSQGTPMADALAFSPCKTDFTDIYVSLHKSDLVEPTCSSKSDTVKPQHENIHECNTKKDNMEHEKSPFTDSDSHGAAKFAQDDDIPAVSKSLSCSLNIAGHISTEGSDDKKHFKISATVTPVKSSVTETSPTTQSLTSQSAFSKKKKSRPSLKKRQRRKRQQGLVTEPLKSEDEHIEPVDLKSNETPFSSPQPIPLSPKHYKTIQALIVESPCKESIQDENEDDEMYQSSKTMNSVAFIIGAMSDSSQSETDSENEDSDWSDYDPISNDDLLQEFSIQEDPFGFLNVQVTCAKSCIPEYASEPVLSPRQKLDLVNLQWDAQHSNLPDVTQSSKKLRKKVSFADGKKIATTYPMIAWDYAYRAARKAPWEMYARDRCRFKDRVRNIERSIGHCVNREHRDKMYARLHAD